MPRRMLLVGLLVAMTLVHAMRDTPQQVMYTRRDVEAPLTQNSTGILVSIARHPIGFFAGNVVLSMIPFPGFTAASGAFAGASFGLLQATFLYTASTVLGTIVLFLITRSHLRPILWPCMSDSLASRVDMYDAAISDEGLRIIFLLRLSPAMPTAITSVLLGLTSVDFFEYCIAGTFGLVPSSFLFVFAGDAGEHVVHDQLSFSQLVMNFIGFVAVGAITFFAITAAQAALDDSLRKYQMPPDADPSKRMIHKP